MSCSWLSFSLRYFSACVLPLPELPKRQLWLIISLWCRLWKYYRLETRKWRNFCCFSQWLKWIIIWNRHQHSCCENASCDVIMFSARPSPKKACSSPFTNNRATPVNIYPGISADACSYSNPYARHVAQIFLYLEQDQATTYLEGERRQMLIHLAGCVKCKSKKKS